MDLYEYLIISLLCSSHFKRSWSSYGKIKKKIESKGRLKKGNWSKKFKLMQLKKVICDYSEEFDIDEFVTVDVVLKYLLIMRPRYYSENFDMKDFRDASFVLKI